MFKRQFLLARDGAAAPPDWLQHRFGELVLHCAPDLPVVALHYDGGAGLVLGWPIYRGQLHGHEEVIRYEEGDTLLFSNLSGRYLVIHADANGARCQLDPCGFLPAVYCPNRHLLASTTGLIATGGDDDDDDDDDEELRCAFDIPAKANWYPFGLTGRKSVRRLLPNHVLDLDHFVVRRYWPKDLPPELPEGGETAPLIAQIASLLRENVAAIAAEEDVMCNLTAGRDSRMMLAAARPYLDRIVFSTFAFADSTGLGDTDMAVRISRSLGLRHRSLECIEPIQADMDEWLVNSGSCVAGRTLQLATSSKAFATVARFSLTGLAGELGRGADSRRSDNALDTLTIPQLIERIGIDLAVIPKSVINAGEAWRAELGPLPLGRFLDVAMIDLWIACCSAPSFYGHCHGGISISPFNDRRLIELMLRLPRRYKLEQRMTTDLLDLLWPELNGFLFNPNTSGRASRMRQRAVRAKRYISGSVRWLRRAFSR